MNCRPTAFLTSSVMRKSSF